MIVRTNKSGKPSLPKNRKVIWQPDSLPGEPLKFGRQSEFLSASEDLVQIDGGKGCIAAETLISGVPTADWNGGSVETLYGREVSSGTFLKGRADLYLVSTQEGKEVVVTLDHRFLTPTGWHQLRDLSFGDLITVSDTEYDPEMMGKSRDFQDCYFSGSHPCGGLPSPVQVDAQDKWLRFHKTVFGNNARLSPCFEMGSLYDRHTSRLSFFDPIVNIKFVKHGDFYDVRVPFANHYVANGILHHNSGKSDLLIIDCLRHEKVSHPRFHAVIFRREYKRLVEIIDRATFWLSQMPEMGAHWQGDKSRFIFPSGAWLAFHNVELNGDEKKYHGWEITDLKFDQLEEFSANIFNFLCLQNRTPAKELSPTVKWTANPIGIGAPWVKKRFVDGKQPGKTYYLTVTDDKGKTYTQTYRRIFATVFDNPIYANDPKYIARLASEPNPYIRKAMFEGNWDVQIGQFFYGFSSSLHVIPSRELDPSLRRLAGFDYGNTKVMEFLACDYDGNVFVEWEFSSEPDEIKPSGQTATEFAENSARFMLERQIGSRLRVVGDTNMWSATGRDVGSDKTPAALIQPVWNKMFKEKNSSPPILVPVSKRATTEYRYRVACNEAVKDYIRYTLDDKGDVILQPKLFIFDRCLGLASQLSTLVTSENDPMDIANPEESHHYDSFKMPFLELHPSRHSKKKQTPKNEAELLEQTVFRKAMQKMLHPKRLWPQR